jgi:hypothetical protein
MVSRLIWFALVSLAAVGCIAAFRWIVGSHVVDRTLPAAVAATGASDTALPLPKGDLLPSPFFAPREIPVATVKVAPTENTQELKATNDEIVNWHWHQGSKVVRRRRAQ